MVKNDKCKYISLVFLYDQLKNIVLCFLENLVGKVYTKPE